MFVAIHTQTTTGSLNLWTKYHYFIGVSAEFCILLGFFFLSVKVAFSRTSLQQILTKLGHMDKFLKWTTTHTHTKCGVNVMAGVKKITYIKNMKRTFQWMCSVNEGGNDMWQFSCKKRGIIGGQVPNTISKSGDLKSLRTKKIGQLI